jgi:microsomal dipeptidase-like Zn-dependent dipeptidase
MDRRQFAFNAGSLLGLSMSGASALNTPTRCEVIADNLLKRGYPARIAEKALGSNFVRAFGELWKS